MASTPRLNMYTYIKHMREEAKSSDVKIFSATCPEMILRRSGFRRRYPTCDFAFNTNISDEIVKCVDIYETDW